MNDQLLAALSALSFRWLDLANRWQTLDPEAPEAHALRFAAHELADTADRFRHRPDAPDPA